MSTRRGQTKGGLSGKRTSRKLQSRTPKERESVVPRSKKKKKTDPGAESFEASLVLLPRDINAVLHRSTDDGERSRNFVLLTKAPACDLQCHENGSIEEVSFMDSSSRRVDLTGVEKEVVNTFMETPLYRWLLSEASAVLWKSEFWSSSILLPCWVMNNGDWTIAWDVIRMYINVEMRTAFTRLSSLVVAEDSDDREMMQLISEIASFGDTDFGLCNDLGDFLNMCGAKVLDQGDELLFSLTRHWKKNRVRLEGVDSRSISDPLRRNKEQTIETLFPIEPGTPIELFAMSAPWLLMFFASPVNLSNVFQFIDAWRMKKLFAIGDELSTAELSESLSRSNDDQIREYKKLASLGMHLLRIVLLLDRSQSSECFNISNAKKESNDVYQEIRTTLIGQKLLNAKPIMDTFFSRVDMQETYGPSLKQQIKTPLYRALTELKTKDWKRIELESQREDILFDNLGQAFRAFFGISYLRGGLGVSWRICEIFGIVERKERSHLSVCIDGWNTDDRSVYATSQRWEVKGQFTHMSLMTLNEEYDALSEKLGYNFNQKYRLCCALVHPSDPYAIAALYLWLVVLGKSYLDFFYQLHGMEVNPEWDQTSIGRQFDENAKIAACVHVAIALKLPFIGLQRIQTLTKIFRNLTSDGDLEILRTEQTSRNYITTMMHAVIGSIAYDSGFSLNTLIPVLRGLFGDEIAKSTGSSATGFVLVKRLVPTYLEARVFEESEGLLTNQYYSTLVQCVRVDEQSGFFGFYILTKKKIPALDDLRTTTFEDIQMLKMTFDSNEDPITIDEDWHSSLLQFQQDYFSPIFPPETRKVKTQEQTKKYFIAPAKKGERGEWKIDWSMMNYITEKTTPDAFISIIRKMNNSDKATLEGIVKVNRSYQFVPEISSTENTTLLEALKQLLFVNSLNQVLSLQEVDLINDKWIGKVVNQLCMQDVLVASYATLQLPPKYVTFTIKELESGSIRLLPFTISYFNCISSIPFILTEFEAKLLAEDYRAYVSLPSSFSNARVLRGLRGPSEKDFFDLVKLEFLGTAVLLFLKVLEIVVENPGVPVGELALKRSAVLKANNNIAPEYDTECLFGHMIFYPFAAYREEAPWHPPAEAPYTLKSVFDVTEKPTKSSARTDVRMLNSVDQRLQSNLVQNIPLAVATKHFKVFAALCFLKEGIEASYEFFRSTRILKMKSYPTRSDDSISQEVTSEGQNLKKYHELEKTIGYKFNDISLLVQVFMHSSLFKGKNNEILEFLGDATIELIAVQFLHEEYNTALLGEAFDMKAGIIRNSSLAWVSLSEPLRLPSYLMHSIADFDVVISPENRSKAEGLKSKTATKICSDIFEALIGAILVDSGYCLETTRKITLRLLKDLLEHMPSFGIKVPST